jgi:hypothetical protein
MINPERNRRSMPLRRVHKYLPHWLKVVLNRWLRRYGDPGDRFDR